MPEHGNELLPGYVMSRVKQLFQTGLKSIRLSDWNLPMRGQADWPASTFRRLNLQNALQALAGDAEIAPAL